MENLWLDSYSYDYEETYWEDKGGDNEDDDNISVMSFNDFARPKHLKIALVFLLDIKERKQSLAFKLVDHLPLSLEILPLIPHLEEVVIQKSTMSHLEQIIIEAPWEGNLQKHDDNRPMRVERGWGMNGEIHFARGRVF